MYNPTLFPSDFWLDPETGQTSGENVPSQVNQTESNIKLLRQQVKQNAVLGLTRQRSLSLASISNQNRGIKLYGHDLPKELVGSKKYPASVVRGIKAILAGGRYIPSRYYFYRTAQAFIYSTESRRWIGVRLVARVSYQHEALANLTDGYVAGGYGYFRWGQWNWRSWPYIDKVNLATESNKYIGWLPSGTITWTWYRNRYGMMANGNRTQGYWFGGLNQYSYYFNTADKIDYSNDSVSQLGIIFPRTIGWGSSSATATDTYILNGHSLGAGYSGNSRYWQYSRYRDSNYYEIHDIYKFNFGTESSSSLGVDPNQDYGGAVADDVDRGYAYVAYGWDRATGYGIKEVERFDTNAETSASTGTQISRLRHGCSGFGSSVNGYFAGGYNGNSGSYSSQQNADRFVYNGETVVPLGVYLSPYLYHTAAIKDFHGGISY